MEGPAEACPAFSHRMRLEAYTDTLQHGSAARERHRFRRIARWAVTLSRRRRRSVERSGRLGSYTRKRWFVRSQWLRIEGVTEKRRQAIPDVVRADYHACVPHAALTADQRPRARRAEKAPGRGRAS